VVTYAKESEDSVQHTAPHPTARVANAFLELAQEKGVPLTPMKLQKLLYFAQGWSLGLRGKSLVAEQPKAWPYGPVFQSVYFACRKYGSAPITAPLSPSDYEATVNKVRTIGGQEELAAEDVSLVRRVWDVYSGYSAWQLSALTHADGGPWAVTIVGAPGGSERPTIADELMQREFSKRAA